MGHPKQRPDPDLDEDLFAFDEVVSAAAAPEAEEDLDEIFASFRESVAEEAPAPDREEELLALPSAPSAKPEHASKPEPAQSPVVPLAAAAQDEARSVATPPAQGPARELVPAARRARFSKGVVAVALAVSVLNSVLALVVLRGPAGGGDVRAVGNQAGATPETGPRTPSLPDPEARDALHAHPALDEARAQISRGEYGTARQRVYALLSVIDRLEDPRRGALEADCQFLIAQSLHLEALARMGGSP